MTDDIRKVLDAIKWQRAQNNEYFMEMWALAFELAPARAKEIQRKLREGDIKITVLNAKLCE